MRGTACVCVWFIVEKRVIGFGCSLVWDQGSRQVDKGGDRLTREGEIWGWVWDV